MCRLQRLAVLFALVTPLACGNEPAADPMVDGGGLDASLIVAKDASSGAGDTGTQNPADTGTQNPADTGTQNPADTGTQNPADTGTQNPADGGTQNPADGGTQNPADTGTQNPADAGSMTPADGGTQNPADAGQTVPGFDPAVAATGLAQAICMHRTRCEPARYGFENNNEMTCIAEQTSQWQALFNSVVPAILAGATSFDAAQYQACIQAYSNSDCGLGLDAGVCDFLLGNRANGQPCAFRQECGSASYCDRPSLGTCGSCAPRSMAGESCVARPCATGLACVEVGQGTGNLQCVPRTVAEGAACGTVATGLCRGQLQCVVNQAGTAAQCARPATNQMACSTARRGTADCNLLNNQLCVMGNCQTVTWNGAGGACTPPALCNETATCNQMSSMCESRPAAGMPCNAGRCAPGTFCDGMTCQAERAAGAACTSSAQCAGSLDCAGPTGQQTCQNLSWQDCTMPTPDAGVTPDAGQTTPDAGAGMDAGVTPDAGAPATLDPAARAAQLATALCQYSTRCEPARHAFFSRTEAQCITELTTEFTAELSPAAAMVSAGRATFDAAQFNTCIAAYGNSDCELGIDTNACDYIIGGRQQGQSCQLNAECAAGEFCSAMGLSICGQCQPRIADGQSCASAPCQAGSSCVEVGQGTGNLLCVASDLGENATCGTVGTGLCRGRLQCVADVFGIRSCTRPAGAGRSCSTQGTRFANCNILANQTCDSGTCQTVTWQGPGQSCQGNNFCDVRGTCDTMLNTCAARPTANQACANGVCAQGFFCENQLCQPERATGGMCTGSNQCQGTLRCVGPTSMSTCQTLTFQSCP